MSKIDSRTLTISALNERRRRAVKMRLNGMLIKEIAIACEMSRTTVIAAHKKYLAGGWSAVDVGRRGRTKGSGRHLSVKQEEIIQKLIQDHTPEQLNLSSALWTRQSVAKVIEERIGVCMPIRTMGEYLLRWGFTPQKPLKKAYEQSPQEVNKWLKEDYPLIAQRAKTEGAEIHWGDETGLRSDDVRGRSYAPKGKTPVLRINAKRVALSVISTVTNKGQMRWKIFHGALDVSILIDFLQRLITGMKKKVFLILDNLRVHHSKVLKVWLGKYTTQIEVFYLQPPNLIQLIFQL